MPKAVRVLTGKEVLKTRTYSDCFADQRQFQFPAKLSYEVYLSAIFQKSDYGICKHHFEFGKEGATGDGTRYDVNPKAEVRKIEIWDSNQYLTGFQLFNEKGRKVLETGHNWGLNESTCTT